MNVNAQQVILNVYMSIQVYTKFYLLTFRRYIAELYKMNKRKLYLYIHDNQVLYYKRQKFKKKRRIVTKKIRKIMCQSKKLIH